MIGIVAKVAFRLVGMTKAIATLDDAKSLSEDILQPVTDEYRRYITKRFDRYSRGQGNWPPKKRGKGRILVKTRAMREGLDDDGVGVKLKLQPGRGYSLSYSFSNNAEHPEAGMSISELATIHDLGLGSVPRRRILVQPDSVTKARMASKTVTIIRKLIVGV